MSTISLTGDFDLGDILPEIDTFELVDELRARDDLSDAVTLEDVENIFSSDDLLDVIRSQGYDVIDSIEIGDFLDNVRATGDTDVLLRNLDEAELMGEIARRGIAPESIEVPLSVVDAVAVISGFFSSVGPLEGKRFIVP